MAGGDLLDEAATRLAGLKQRLTPNRRQIVSVLATGERPLTIPEILERAPGLAQSSAYRNLVVLEQADVVHRVVTHDEFARYELAEDLTEHHHHLVCTRCGRVEDVPSTAALERSLAAAIEAAGTSSGFTIEHHRLDLLGCCGNCRARAGASA